MMTTPKRHGMSQHAIDRINERSNLTRPQVTDILDLGAYVDLGSLPGIPRKHLLFYSTIDESFFVVIRNNMDGGVITLLPIEYMDNSGIKVSEEQKAQALTHVKLIDKIIGHMPPMVLVGVSFKERTAKSHKNKVIMKRDHDYSQSLEDIVKDLNNLTVASLAFSQGVLASDIESVTVKIGFRSLPKYFKFPFENDDSSLLYTSENIK